MKKIFLQVAVDKVSKHINPHHFLSSQFAIASALNSSPKDKLVSIASKDTEIVTILETD